MAFKILYNEDWYTGHGMCSEEKFDSFDTWEEVQEWMEQLEADRQCKHKLYEDSATRAVEEIVEVKSDNLLESFISNPERVAQIIEERCVKDAKERKENSEKIKERELKKLEELKKKYE